jgi:hypothetical protein
MLVLNMRELLEQRPSPRRQWAHRGMIRVLIRSRRFAEISVLAFGSCHGGGLMRAFLIYVAINVAAPLFVDDPDLERVAKHLQSDNYKVNWGTKQSFGSDSELEIGDGSGHGFTLGWMRFRPQQDSVDILSIKLELGRQPYRSKWPPERAPITVQSAQMPSRDYEALLRQMGVVVAAELRPSFDELKYTHSSADFWVDFRLTAKNKTLIEQSWAGYPGNRTEVECAKPKAAVAIARAAIKDLEFKDHALTDEDRKWASAKFNRDWSEQKDSRNYWWVRERYIITIGVVGDASVLPTLQEILTTGNPKDRCVYHAVNAVTRLTNEDVREKPVEEMDIEKTRERVLELLRNRNEQKEKR